MRKVRGSGNNSRLPRAKCPPYREEKTAPMSYQNAPRSIRSLAPPPRLDSDPFDPVAAFQWAAEICRHNFLRVVTPIVGFEIAILSIVWAVPGVLGWMSRSWFGIPQASFLNTTVTFVQYALGLGLGGVATGFASAVLYPYLIELARGRSVDYANALRLSHDFVPAIQLVTLQLVAFVVGCACCGLPGVGVVLVNFIALPVLIDQGVSPWSAVRQSFEMLRSHFVPTFFFGLLSIVITLVGVAVCAVGAVFVSIPLVMLAQIYVYLRLRGETPVGVS
jgi:hypothetical protein